MREILFRGKRLDNGEWIEGAYCPKSCDSPFGPMIDKPSIIKLDDPFSGFWFDVDPSTVGQYTAQADKNGKKIFEGDICQVGHLLYMVEFNYSQWKFSILSDKVYCYPAFNSHCGERCIIIGNIYDNPELLEDVGR